VDTATEIIYRAGEIAATKLEEVEAADADVVIRPEVGDLHWADFVRCGELIKKGETACLALLGDIENLLGQARTQAAWSERIAGFFRRIYRTGRK